jgi:hypothetical protein
MHYAHDANADTRASPSYLNGYQITTLDKDGAHWVGYYANNVAPPQAADRASVTENCQGWVVRVLRELQAKNVVERKRVDEVASYVEPIQ